VLTVVGDVSPGEALEQVHRFFGAIPARPSVPEVAPPGELAPSGEQRQVVLDEVPAIRLFVGYRCPAYSSADFPALTLLSVVLGGGRGSRLYRSLVIERELAQPAGGVLADQLPLVHGNGLLLCDVLGREGVPLAALEEGFEAVVQQTDGMAGDEIERARALLVAEWLHRLSSFERRADAFGEAVCLFDDADRVSTQLSRLVSTTAENVQRIAERVLVPANRVVLPFLPKDADDEAGSGR
jgi:predicted Zn-dependent peptidase